MKRSASASPSPSKHTSSAISLRCSSDHRDSSSPSSSAAAALPQDGMACKHLSEAFGSLNAPRSSQQIYRDECTLCFDDQDGPNGVDVCLLCFNGSCTGNQDREHSRLHFQKTGHSIAVNVRRSRRKRSRAERSLEKVPKKLAISAETEEDLYEWQTRPKCLACDPDQGGRELPRTDKLDSVISAMMNSLSSSQQSEVKAWEEEIVPCNHTKDLIQHGEPFSLEAGGAAKCGKCHLTSNLWLCLTCGNLGCGRAQFGGIGGNSHGLSHFEESGHPVSVKQGTITAEGTADIYCYACNDARIDPNLAEHLRHFGMNVQDLSKTEKSMTELQLEQNMKFDFNMTGEDGRELEPLFGPGLTGLRNLGNSCYLASTLQSLFSFPAFQTRYLDAYQPHTTSCGSTLPATCLECQMGKLADGMLSGRYAVPRPADEAPGDSDDAVSDAGNRKKESGQGPIFQAGIRPSMFKDLIGRGHEEFSTMRQQDADEFLKHIVTCLQKDSRRLSATAITGDAPINDPTTIFSFGLEQRLQCMACKKVRYSVEIQDAGLSLPIPLKKKMQQNQADSGNNGSIMEYEPVSLEECLDIFTSAEELEYHCPSCQKNVTATKRTRFTSFPEVFAVQARRFQLINWVPQKVDVPLLVPLESFQLDKYLGKGKTAEEEELPESGEQDVGKPPGGDACQAPQFDTAVMSQLTSMGFPETRCQRALLATGNTGDVEGTMNWLFAHMDDADIDDPIDFTSLSATPPPPPQAVSSIDDGAGADTSMLEEMGFVKSQARKALRLNSNNAELAVAWLFENPDDEGEEAQPIEGIQADGGAGGGGGTTAAAAAGQGSGATSTRDIGGSSDLPATYRLRAFVSHKGPSVHSGHYVAHVRKGGQVPPSRPPSHHSPATTISNPRMDTEEGESQSHFLGNTAAAPHHHTGSGDGFDRGGRSNDDEEAGENWVLFNDEKVVRAPLQAQQARTTKDPGKVLLSGEKEGEKQEGKEEEEKEGQRLQNDVGVRGLSRLAYVYFFERERTGSR